MNELFKLFEEIGLPYFRQGSLSDSEYPSSFFTFWNVDTPNNSFYDNYEHRYTEIISVCFYTNDAATIYSGMNDFIVRAKEKGFVLKSRPNDTNAGKDDFFGRVVMIQIINKLED